MGTSRRGSKALLHSKAKTGPDGGRPSRRPCSLVNTDYQSYMTGRALGKCIWRSVVPHFHAFMFP